MIGQIRGIILEKQAPQLLVDVQGIGYEVDAPLSTFYQLPDVSAEVKLYTHLVVREDAHQLYGFYTQAERHLFRTLLKVNGVGPKLALTILSSITTDEFVQAIVHNNTANLVRVPGVGKKTAERLVIEMRDKLQDWQGANSDNSATKLHDELGPRQNIHQDAVAALIALGYKPQEAKRVISKVDDGAASSEHLIRLALREMV